jgi:UPF0755 protein
MIAQTSRRGTNVATIAAADSCTSGAPRQDAPSAELTRAPPPWIVPVAMPPPGRPTPSAPPNPPRRRRSSTPPRAPGGPGAKRAGRAAAGLRAQIAALSPRLRGLVWGAAALLGTLSLALVALLLGYGRTHGSGARLVEIDWPADLSSEDAAHVLAESGLVASEETMAIFLRATGGTSDLVPGPHLLFEGASPWELRRLLSRSILRPSAKVTIPEGFNRFDIAARLEKLRVAGRRAFLAASADPALLAELSIAPAESAEGYLFPATYDLGLDSDPRDIVRRLVAESDKRWEPLLARHKDTAQKLQATLGWGRKELVTVASIIEKEAAVDDDRPLVASVFVNRLLDPEFKTHRLQSDPTSSYGCIAWPTEAPSCADFAGKPTPAINRDPKNRYSTYTHAGLPPGPISNPGARSLEAALSPPTTRFLYFVATGGGRHTFSETLDAHNDAIQHGRPP